MEQELKRIGREIALVIGLIVIALVIGGLIVWAIYSVVGTLTDNGRHWLAVGLTFAVPGAYLLGLQHAKSHKAGLQQGLDLKLSARERAHQSARPVPVAAQPYKPQHDDLLPHVGTMQIIDASSGRGEIVD